MSDNRATANTEPQTNALRLNNPFKRGSVFGRRFVTAFGSFLTFRHGTARIYVYAVGRLCVKISSCWKSVRLKVKKSKKLPGFFPHFGLGRIRFLFGQNMKRPDRCSEFSVSHLLFRAEKLRIGKNFKGGKTENGKREDQNQT